METRSKAQSRRSEAAAVSSPSCDASSNSGAASGATVLAKKRAAEARHARFLAEEAALTAAAKRAAADAELAAEIAAIEADAASSRSSRRSSRRSQEQSQASRVSGWVSESRQHLSNSHIPFMLNEGRPSSAPVAKDNIFPHNTLPYGTVPYDTVNRPSCDPVLPIYSYAGTTAAQQPPACASVPAPPGQTEVPTASQVETQLAGRDMLPPGAHLASATAALNAHFVPSPVALVAPALSGPANAPCLAHAANAYCGTCASSGLQRQLPSRYQPEPPCTHIGTHHTNPCYNKNKFYENDLLTLARAVTEVAQSSGTNAKKHSNVSLPLPIFEGRPTEWLIFKKVYDATSPSFSATENLVRISSALRGFARDSVSVLIAAAREPMEVMHALETTFARPEHIILAEIAQVKGLSKLSGLESVHELCMFACRVRNCAAVIKLLGRSEYLASPELSNEIIAKMTPLLRARWADYASSRESDGHRLLLLSDFLSKEADQRAKYEVFVDPPKRLFRGGPTKDLCFNASVAPSSVNLVCLFCGVAGHHVKHCKQFASLTSADRWLWVDRIKVCHKCLTKGGHRYLSCKKDTCNVKSCDKRWAHNTLLHKEDVVTPNKSSRQFTGQTTLSTQNKPEAHLLNSENDTATSDVLTVVTSHNLSSPKDATFRPLLKIVPITVRGPKGDVDTFALLDDGSTATLVDSSITDAIGLVGTTSTMRVEAINGMAKDCKIKLVDLHIKGRFCETWHTLTQVRSICDLGLSQQSVRVSDAQYPHLAGIAEKLCYDDAKPTVLIGIDHWHLTLTQQVRRGSRVQPVAALTSLGWVLFGALKGKANELLNCAVINRLSVEPVDDSLEQINGQLRDYFKIDSIGISNQVYHSENDRLAIKTLEETTKRLPDGRFETGLPWRPNITKVPNSFEFARSRFIGLERKMNRDPKYAEVYRQFINSTIAKGYAELCQSKPVGGITWYLPHFGVVHPQKRKLRVVYDAAATCQGISLNSMLLAGPDLLQPLLAILMRFREGAIALSGDIREMFPQTKIRQEDRDAQRFLWRDDPSKPLLEYRMSSMMFGAVSSPFTAQYLKNRNAEENRDLYPDAADAIVKDHYMDDYLGSVDTVETARTLAANIVDVHAKARLEMRSWVSNDPSALSLVPENLRATEDASTVAVRVLGVIWDIKADTLQFSRKTFDDLPPKLTKRSVLAYLMKVFDPLGLLTPFVIRGRILFQQTWKLSVEWDQALPPRVESQWNAWFRGYNELLVGSIPRHYLDHQTAHLRPQLHVFADASELAYACVAYWRFECTDGAIKLSLIGGKARVAPLKPVSILRLVLQAALTAARLYQYIIDAHKHFFGQTVRQSSSGCVAMLAALSRSSHTESERLRRSPEWLIGDTFQRHSTSQMMPLG